MTKGVDNLETQIYILNGSVKRLSHSTVPLTTREGVVVLGYVLTSSQYIYILPIKERISDRNMYYS